MSMPRPLFTGSYWQYIKSVSTGVFFGTDTVTIRLLLANASLLWVIGLVIDPNTFDRSVYSIMRQFGNEVVWAIVFFVHGLGVYWRIFDPISRPNWALAVNLLGFVAWAVSTLSLNLAVARFSPTTAMEWTLVAASAWALYRTGFKEVVTP